MIEKLQQELNLLERHLEILQLVFERQPIGIVNISNETGHPHHKVRYSLRVMEGEGLIEATQQGAVPTEKAEEFVTTFQEKIDEVIDKIEIMKA